MTTNIQQKASLAPQLDNIDWHIIRALQTDPHLPIATLSRQIGLSIPAVRARVRRLETNGVITYRLDINPLAIGLPLRAYLRLQPYQGNWNKVIGTARNNPHVVECHRIAGDAPFQITLQFPAIDALDHVLQPFVPLGTINVSIVYESPVPLRSLPLPENP